MNPDTANAYANLFLLIAVVVGVGFVIYRATRKKPVAPREVPKRPETYRPRARQEESGDDEEVASSLPVRDWREKPTVKPMHTAVPKAPTFKSVIQKPKASTGVHSPIRGKEVE